MDQAQTAELIEALLLFVDHKPWCDVARDPRGYYARCGCGLAQMRDRFDAVTKVQP